MWNNNIIEDEIQRNSLEYGVSVNTDRSIPDAKSGLKPVAKRILYDAFVEGRTADKPHVKSARICGSVMGTWHPHGDSSIYGAMIRLSQRWVMRYPLIDVHGNNGTILGDGPAAARYTEARLSKIAEDGMLQGLKKRNVDFVPNYDETEEEPVTLPAIFPNLLCNPNEGIGWAMGSSWCAHNLGEVQTAILDYLDGKEPMLPGPDFPTGGIVINKNDIPNIMRTGHGSVKIRGKYKVEGNNIIFYEIPYGVRLEPLMEQIGAVCDEGKIAGVADVRNETGKNSGLKLVIEVTKGTNPLFVINQLFAKTDLQSSFSYNQVALIGKTPTELNLKGAIEVYVNHNIDCIVREAQFDLKKAAQRLHIVDGLIKALEDIDNIIALIKKSESSTAAKAALIAKYQFSEEQAKAILAMRLSSLAKLEKVELECEKAELEKTINELNALINERDKQIEELKLRLARIVSKYGDARRTELCQIEEPKGEDKEIINVEPEKCVVVMSEGGLIKRIPTATFRTQRKNGKGIKTPNDINSTVIRTNTIDSLMVFTNFGQMYRILVDNIPSGTNTTKGTPLTSLIQMEKNEVPAMIYSIYRDTDAKYILFVTKNGIVKKTSLDEYSNTKKKSGVVAIKLRDGDSLASVNLIKDEDVIITTANGQAIKIAASDVAASSRNTIGLKGIGLRDEDYVVCALPIRNVNDSFAVFTSQGLGKKMSLSDFPKQNRGGKGLTCYKPDNTTGLVVGGALVSDEDNILISSPSTSICISASEITKASRNASGIQLIKAKDVNWITKI